MFISMDVPLRFNKTDVKCAWISNTIDWEYSSNLSLMSISSYVVHSTKETGNIYTLKSAVTAIGLNRFFLVSADRFKERIFQGKTKTTTNKFKHN